MKKLACRLGRHRWTARVEEGETYKVCAHCGKLADSTQWAAQKQDESEKPTGLGGGQW